MASASVTMKNRLEVVCDQAIGCFDRERKTEGLVETKFKFMIVKNEDGKKLSDKISHLIFGGQGANLGVMKDVLPPVHTLPLENVIQIDVLMMPLLRKLDGYPGKNIESISLELKLTHFNRKIISEHKWNLSFN